MDCRQRGNLMCPQSGYKLKRRGHLLSCVQSQRRRLGMRGENDREESCRVWKSQTGSIRGVTTSFTTGPPKWSSHRVYGEIWGIWQETDTGEIEENIMVNWWGSSVLLSSQTTLEWAVTAHTYHIQSWNTLPKSICQVHSFCQSTCDNACWSW